MLSVHGDVENTQRRGPETSKPSMRLWRLCLVVALACATRAVRAEWTQLNFTNCTGDFSLLHLDRVYATPFPAEVGNDFFVSFVGVLDGQLSSGKVTVNVLWGGQPALNNSYSLCKMFGCPWQAGFANLTMRYKMPSVVYGGVDYAVVFNASNQDGEPLFCANFTVEIEDEGVDGEGDFWGSESGEGRQGGRGREDRFDLFVEKGELTGPELIVFDQQQDSGSYTPGDEDDRLDFGPV
jgi:hypothetical protein